MVAVLTTQNAPTPGVWVVLVQEIMDCDVSRRGQGCFSIHSSPKV
jgi:hypothetical protein